MNRKGFIGYAVLLFGLTVFMAFSFVDPVSKSPVTNPMGKGEEMLISVLVLLWMVSAGVVLATMADLQKTYISLVRPGVSSGHEICSFY